MQRDISIVDDVRALVRWTRFLRRISPQIVFAGTPKAGLLANVAARIAGVPRRIYFLQGLRLEGAEGARLRMLATMERLASWCSSVVIAVSPSLASEFRRLHLNSGRAIEVPHLGSSHGVDATWFSPDANFRPLAVTHPELAEVAADRPVFTFIGRLTRDKGPAELLRASQMLLEERANFHLVVLGKQDEGDSRSYLERFQSSDVETSVVDHVADVRPYLAASRALILPTWREGMPNVVLEAGAMKVPAITTSATGAVDSVIHNVTGLIVAPRDAAALASAMKSMLDDPAMARRLGAAARERVVRDFSPGLVARSIYEIAVDGML